MELAALDAEFDAHYDDICEDEGAREELRTELGTTADGAPVTDEPPAPVPDDARDDDHPPPLDRGVGRVHIDAPQGSRGAAAGAGGGGA